MFCLKTGILIFAMFMLSSPFSQIGKAMNLAPAKSRLDPQKTYVRIVQNVVLSSSQRASIWHIPSGTTVEKIMTVISPQKADELWLVASLDKNIFGHRQHGVISLKAIQENHHLIAVQEEISRHDKVL